jgi:hypothetical protein
LVNGLAEGSSDASGASPASPVIYRRCDLPRGRRLGSRSSNAGGLAGDGGALGPNLVFAIIDREAQKQRSQQGQPQQSPGSGVQGSLPQTGTNQPSPSQQQGDELTHRKSTMPHKGHSREGLAISAEGGCSRVSS